MALADEYRLQAPWRDWTGAFYALPAVRGQRVLDLGCALGDQATELVRRGARVLGIDGDEDLLQVARTRGLTNAEFICQDLRDLRLGDDRFDGLWSSFTAAYLVDLPHALHSWKRWLAPGAWIALVEVDDLFAHEPVRDETRRILSAYAEDAVTAGRYDFRMGRRLRPSLEAWVSLSLPNDPYPTTSSRSLAVPCPRSSRPGALDGSACPSCARSQGSTSNGYVTTSSLAFSARIIRRYRESRCASPRCARWVPFVS
jgi:ubiquinone/menaquinone biosynthesis C-methylase UbiE